VDVDRDLAHGKPMDLRTVKSGEGCPRCEGTLEVYKGLEIGHIFKLGTKYSESMNARILGPDGKETPIVMGSYGIGVERVMAAAIELHHDADGIRWPMSIAPYQVALLPLQMNDAGVVKVGEELYAALTAAGVEVLYDERDERAGVKFKDADLIGLPVRVTVGPRGLKEGKVEVKARTASEATEVPLGEAAARVADLVGPR
jgi:prolyl-tRNA synthetase